jgi:protocatechuate 3,4-dioxygenase beta subunit
MKTMDSCLVLALALLPLPAFPQDAARVAPDNGPSSGEVAPASEPGERLEVSGAVYATDGKTPIAGASVYVFQTDARGYYRPEDAMANRNPRLKALLRTDARGRYSYRTIRPGSYPGTRMPKHIHYEVSAAGHAPRVFEIVFDDDPFVTDEIRAAAARPGSFYSLRTVQRGTGGTGRLIQDVVLTEGR